MWNKKVQYKMENNEFKKVPLENYTHCYFYDIIKLEDFDHNKISIDKKS